MFNGQCSMVNVQWSMFNVSLPELEVVLGVVVGDVLHHLADTVDLAERNLAVLHVGTEQVAECAAEILVSGIGEEGA